MTYDDIAKALEKEFPGIDLSIWKDWILEALQDLCRKTWIYTEIITFLTTAGTVEHTISPSDTDSIPIGIVPWGAEWQVVDTPVVTIAAGIDTGALTQGSTYYYKVTAISDTYGQTMPSTAVSKAATATKSLVLTWTAIDGADSYYVYMSTDGTSYYFLEEAESATYTDDGDESVDTDITPPTKSELVKKIAVSNEIQEKIWNDHWKYKEGDDIQRVIYDGYTTVRLEMIPETTGMGFQLEVALMPTAEPSAGTIPNIFIQFKDVIKDYLRFKAYLAPKTKTRDYQNPTVADFFYGRYVDGRAEIKIAKLREFGAHSSLQLPYFA